MTTVEEARDLRLANALGIPVLVLSAGTEAFKSDACRHPRAHQAPLTDADLASAERHPAAGERPEWSGYCVVADQCTCNCHSKVEQLDSLADAGLSLGDVELPDVAVEDTGSLIASCRCGVRWNGMSLAHCAVCHLTFTTVNNFDYHIRGGNRCRTADELRAKGYEPNPAGHWRKPIPEDQRPAGWS